VVPNSPCIPIIYLPGYSRQDLRAVETCPDALKPIAELQYRGALWSQVNAKDWTVFAFVKSDQGGLGLDVASDNETKNAMLLALDHLMSEDLDLLKGKHLDRDYFNKLVTGGDPVRDLLKWLDSPEEFKASKSANEWQAFLDVTKSQFAFQPENDGVLKAAEKLAHHQGPWAKVWERFCEAPKPYVRIPDTIRKVKAPSFDLFSDASTSGGWPQWNDEQEIQLRSELKQLSQLTGASSRIKELETKHSTRRQLVWADLGYSPLARALTPLSQIATLTQNSLVGGTVDEMAQNYLGWGWKVDAAVTEALRLVEKADDIESVIHAIRTLYTPWLDASAKALQALSRSNPYPGNAQRSSVSSAQEGDCILFVDGLRLDVANCLKEALEARGSQVAGLPVWCPLPSVTATGKPLVTPVHDQFMGPDHSDDFEPVLKSAGQKGTYALRKAIANAGWICLEKNDPGNGKGKAWCEFGDLDHEGHERDWKLAKHLPALIHEIAERIELLLQAGWKRVRVVTDHGWLLLPGGLPKVELPSALVDSKWGRCASVKEGATTDAEQFPWYWNKGVFFALPPGISCYRKTEYSHGGLSLQECLTLELTVSGQASKKPHNIQIVDISWKGQRCGVTLEGDATGCALDIRTSAGNATTSVVMEVKPFDGNGVAKVLVEDDSLEGQDAMIVVLGDEGSILAQIETKIGRSE
jgi:hypothetical protein